MIGWNVKSAVPPASFAVVEPLTMMRSGPPIGVWMASRNSPSIGKKPAGVQPPSRGAASTTRSSNSSNVFCGSTHATTERADKAEKAT
jgi:hypothetical protein